MMNLGLIILESEISIMTINDKCCDKCSYSYEKKSKKNCYHVHTKGN